MVRQRFLHPGAAALLAWLLASAAVPARADRVMTYRIDPARTRITFTWNYLGMTSPVATFGDVSGRIYGNLDRPEASWAEVKIPVRSLRTFMPLIDRELLESGDFFKPREFPEMRFRSDGILHVDKSNKTFSLTGTLTVNGITRPVILSAKVAGQGLSLLAGNGQTATLKATTTFRRSEFGMNRMLGIVSDEMAVDLQVHAVEKHLRPEAVEPSRETLVNK